jgi:UDP-GlcNAc:undecaprenyl-phosphate/decaprenyl-phosphate GlcNAc-1-phosphate transferase
MSLLIAFMVALAITMLLVPPLGRLATSLKLLDRPAERKVHTTPVPRIGGTAMVLGVAAALGLTIHDDRALPAYLLGALIVLVFGLLDDRFDLDYRIKLFGQVAAALVAILLGDFRIESLTLTDRLSLPEWVSLPLTFFFIVGVTNAINLADGLDGLAGGTVLLCAAALTAFGVVADNALVAIAGAALVGALLGFLRFNTHPARVFMGDGGSQFLGFSVAILAIDATQRDSAFSAALPLLLLAWPILDTLAVMASRIAAGQSPFAADRRHLHHRLLGLGFGHREAVYVVYAVQVALFLVAYFMRFEQDTAILLTFVAFSCLVLGTVHWLEARHWSRGVPATQSAAPDEAPADSAPSAALIRWPLAAMTFAVVVYAASVPAGVGPVSHDIGLLALVLLATQLVVMLLPQRSWSSAVQRGICYVMAAALVFLDHHGLGWFAPLSWPVTLCFMLLAFSVVVSFRLSGARRFELTTLDLLVISLAIIVPSLPGLFGDSRLVGASLAKVFALFYALEFLLNLPRATRGVQLALVALLVALLPRAFMS